MSNSLIRERGCALLETTDTEDLLVTELMNMGIPQDKIRLGFVSPEAQAYLDHGSDRVPCDDLAVIQQQIAV